MVEEDARVDESALRIDGEHAAVPQPRILVVVAERKCLAAAVIRRARLRAGGERSAGRLCPVLEPQAILRKGRRLITAIVLDAGEVAVHDRRELGARAPLVRRQNGKKLRPRLISEPILPPERTCAAAQRS